MSATASMRIPARAFIIDLDGTLLDTAADLAAAVNAMREELGRVALPVDTVRAYVGKGAEVLVHRALGEGLEARVDSALHALGMAAFGRHYAVFNGRFARAYPGVREGLDAMRGKGLALACVTNKPQAFADPLLERCGMRADFAFVLGGDALERRKPDPLPMIHAARRLGVAPGRVVAIGDSLNDAQAARAAGMPVLAVPYGYNEGRDVRSLDVDAIVDSLEHAASMIDLAA